MTTNDQSANIAKPEAMGKEARRRHKEPEILCVLYIIVFVCECEMQILFVILRCTIAAKAKTILRFRPNENTIICIVLLLFSFHCDSHSLLLSHSFNVFYFVSVFCQW